jgi:hypothetical protein
MNMHQAQERANPREDPFFHERLESMKQTAISLSHHRIDHPNKLSALRSCPDIFVQYIVTVETIEEYIQLFKDDIVGDELEMVRLINLYRVKVSCPGEFSDFEKPVFFNHLNWFFQNLSVGSATLVNSFIRLLLVLSRRKYLSWANFPNYFLSFGEIDYHVFFNCVNECMAKSTEYHIMPVVGRFVQGLEDNLKKFNRSFQGKETDPEVVAVVDMFVSFIVRLRA